MKKYILLFFLFIQKKNYHSTGEALLINIIYYGIERCKSTIDYLKKFKTYFISNTKLHHNIASRMKNPSKNNNTEDLYIDCQNAFLQYTKSVEKIIYNYYQYKSILNNLYETLNYQEKNEFNSYKKNAIIKIIKEIFNIKNLLQSIQNIIIEFNTIDKNIFHTIKEKINIDELYPKINAYKSIMEIYNIIDNNLLHYNSYINNINIFFYQQYEKILNKIELIKLEELINLYNKKIKEYYEKYNKYPEKIKYNSTQFINEGDLPPWIETNI